MRLPRGERYVAATWIAVIVAGVCVVVGTVALLSVREELPARIPVRWDGQTPIAWLGLTALLWVAGGLTLAAGLVPLLVGFAVRRSVRSRAPIASVVFTVIVAAFGYGNTWDQTRPDFYAPGSPPIPVLVVSGLLVIALYWWLRPPAWTDEATATSPRTALPAPDTARLAWAGAWAGSWPLAVAQTAITCVPAVVLWWWLGLTSSLVIFLAIFVPLSLTNFRKRQIIVDYSGVGLRQRSHAWVPSAVPINIIRSAETGTVSALRDFGGWGPRKADDGREGWIGRSGEALVVHRIGRPDYVLTVDDAAEAAAVLNTLVERQRRWERSQDPSYVDLPHPYGDRV